MVDSFLPRGGRRIAFELLDLGLCRREPDQIVMEAPEQRSTIGDWSGLDAWGIEFGADRRVGGVNRSLPLG